MLARTLPCVLLWAAQCAHGASTIEENAEYQLRKKFTDLKAFGQVSRPVKTYTDRVDVKVGLAVTGVMSLDEEAGTVTSSVELTLRWKDAYLTWQDDCTDVTGCFPVSHLYIDPSDEASFVWVPDVNILNSVDVSTVDTTAKAMLYPNGTIVWVRSLVVQSRCDFDFLLFPFDRQDCGITMGPTILTEAQQRITYSLATANHTGISFDTVSWKRCPTTLNGTVVPEMRVFADPETSEVSQATYTIPLQRYPMFYLSNGVIPVLLVTLMVYLSFWLPVTMVERMDFGATSLLSIVAVMFVIADKLPTQMATTTMDTFFFISLLFNLIALVESCIVVTFATNVQFRSMKASLGFFFSPKVLDLGARFVWPVCYIVVCNNLLQTVLAAAGFGDDGEGCATV